MFYFIVNKGWLLAFRGTPGIGGEPYEAWLNNTNVTTTDVTCHLDNMSACPKYYRNRILDNWEAMNVSKVTSFRLLF